MANAQQNAQRTAKVERRTAETDIVLEVNLDGSGAYSIDSGVEFLDHMLANFSRHAGFDLTLACKGDTGVDDHHSVEDIAIVMGEAILAALGNRTGIQRYGWAIIPMDEALVRSALDLGGRSYCVFRGEFSRPEINGFSTEMIEHFFVSLSRSMQANIHIAILEGSNTHHKMEAIFKSFAYAIKQAVSITGTAIPSTKGVL